MIGSAASGQHVSPEALAAYIDKRLDQDGRAAVVAHLADCADCRQELIDARRVLRPGRAGRVAGVAVGLALAASLLVMVLPIDRTGAGRESSQVRSGTEPTSLVAYGPIGELISTAVELVWGSAGPNAAYRVALTMSDGTPVWRTSTSDTVAAVPDSVRLGPDATYRWWVDALLPDGTTRSTGIREFRTPP